MTLENKKNILDVEFNPHKILLLKDKLTALARGEDLFPVTVEVDPVDYCNHGCDWCVDPRHGGTALDLETARFLLQELRELGVSGVVFKGGGEPTLHESFPELLRCSGELGFETGVVTNGSRLMSMYDPIARYASYLRVSLDGPTPKSHHRIHGSSDFEEILLGINKVVEARGRKRRPVIGLSFAMDYSMIHLVRDAIDLGQRLETDYVLFRTPFYEEVGREPTMTIQQATEVRKAFVRAKQTFEGDMVVLTDHWISDAEAARVEMDDLTSPRRGAFRKKGANGIEHVTGRCLASPLLAVVTADQNVYPCCNLRALEGWSIGRLDYASNGTFYNLWLGEKRREILKRIHKIECIPWCTHPMSRYNEAIEYLSGPKFHNGFV